ncbi:MAG: SUMF1/EgtB/PvdO family nonheme iron enzyme [Deltaproteobacteria bacterium]|nr:SUMF1/EgtB/PvdO family nonheme iron enzyme [Deltaproteobacteria bacterium]
MSTEVDLGSLTSALTLVLRSPEVEPDAELVLARLCDRARDLGGSVATVSAIKASVGELTPEGWRRACALELALSAAGTIPVDSLVEHVLTVARARDECDTTPEAPRLEDRVELLSRALATELGLSIAGENAEESTERFERLSSSFRAARARGSRRRMAPTPFLGNRTLREGSVPDGFLFLSHQGRHGFFSKAGPLRLRERLDRKWEDLAETAERRARVPHEGFLSLERGSDGSALEESVLGFSLAALTRLSRGPVGLSASAILRIALDVSTSLSFAASERSELGLEVDPASVFIEWSGRVRIGAGKIRPSHRAPDWSGPSERASVYSVGALAYSLAAPGEADEAAREAFRYARPGAIHPQLEPIDGLISRTVAPETQRLRSLAALMASVEEATARVGGMSQSQLSELVLGLGYNRHNGDSRFLARAILLREGAPADSDEMTYVPALGSEPAFLIDVRGVRNKEYGTMATSTHRQLPPGWFHEKFSDRPVVLVSHADAASFAELAGKRLPTEREWERASDPIFTATHEGAPREWTSDWGQPRISKVVRGPQGYRGFESDRAPDLGFRCALSVP